jgi:hypothetical protein
MRTVIGSDHTGYEMKEQIVDVVRKFRHEVSDVGTHESDKPDGAYRLRVSRWDLPLPAHHCSFSCARYSRPV